jgi:RNA polymerase sigma factor (sigma-70 family)
MGQQKKPGSMDFDGIVQTQRSGLVRLVSRRFARFSAAEDVVQEAFLKLSQMGDQVKDPAAFLSHVTMNLARNVVRSENRRARYESYADLYEGDADTITPERQVAAHEEVERLKLALSLLPPVCGEVFRLHRLEGLTQAEVARRLGISTTAVEKSMRRALNRLAAALEDVRAEQSTEPSDR